MQKKWIVFLLSLSFLFFSCDNEEDPISENNESESEAIFKDAMYMNAEINSHMGMGLSAFAGSGGRLAENDVFCGSLDFSFQPSFAIELDFGAGCAGADGKNRKGKIKFTTSGEFGEEGFSFILTYDGFSVDGNQLSGSVSSSGYLTNSEGNFEYTLTFTDMLLTLAEDSSTIAYSGSHTYEWVEGYGSEDPATSVFKVTGSSSGITRKGIEYNSEITTPYMVKSACYGSGIFYPVSGQASITPVGAQAFTVDFGEGSCDKKVTIEAGALTYEVDLP